MPAENGELVQAKYYCRHLQLKKIAQEVDSDSELGMRNFLEANEKNGWMFTALLMTPRVYTEALVKAATPERQKNLWEGATLCLKLVAKDAYSRNICNKLIIASAPQSRGTKFVELDDFRSDPPDSLVLAFASNPEALELGHIKGKAEAIDYLFGRFSGGIPLLRYRMDLLKKITPVSASQKGGVSVGYLPTIVPGLDLRLLYTSESNIPNASFLMRAFESES